MGRTVLPRSKYVSRKHWLGLAAIVGMAWMQGNAQAPAQQKSLPAFIQKAQTVYIPINAFAQENTASVKDLKASDLSLDIDGKPHAFQLSRPWDRTINPKTGQAEDRPNLLIIVPFDGPQYRKDGLDEAIHDLSAEPNLGWNISILDDGGDQTPYTRDMKTVVAELQKIEHTNPADTDLDTWRRTASLAIASMRNLPGRRVVMTLGDIYHEMVFDGMQLVYENFEAHDVAAAARESGAVIYAAESFQEIGRLRGLFPYYYTLGFGPWMLLTRDDHLEGWISNFVSDTITEIRQDGMGAYDIDIHLDASQMDGEPHAVSVTSTRSKLIMNVPPYYMAPNLQQLQELAEAPPKLRQVLQHPAPDSSSPMQLATQLEYFPHPAGNLGTQLITTGFFWTKPTPPPANVIVALQLQQTNTGYMVATIVGKMNWSIPEPQWSVGAEMHPGAYVLRVAAMDPTGNIVASTVYPFSVEPPGNVPVRISSLVLGKSCTFAPVSTGQAAKAQSVSYLRAGNCDIQPDASHYFSPQDVLWTLARITPTGKFAQRPSKDWKGSFVIINTNGEKLVEEPIRWLTASDGSFVATTAFQLDNPKLKLVDGEYAVVLTLKGPGIERNYGEDAPFAVYGAAEDAKGEKK